MFFEVAGNPENRNLLGKGKGITDTWSAINRGLIDTYGVSDEAKALIAVKKEYMALAYNVYVRGQKHLKAIMNVKARQIDELEATTKNDVVDYN